jgi:CDP-diacylglycerol--serine O-phosphatidyltransferase
MNSLANLLTILSLMFGFLSIIFSLESHFTFASWSIIISVIFDGLDGQLARKNPVSSEFGKELDSLVDVVSFGIAPSILGYVFVYEHFQLLAALALFIYLLCSILRLAKYNITPKEKLTNYFIGLPTTASGALLASFILIYRKKQAMIIPGFMPDIFLPQYIPEIFLLIVLILSVLMVSRVKYLNLDGLKLFFGKKSGLLTFAIALILIIAVFLNKAGVTLFTIFLIYLLFPPFMVKRLDKIQPR